MSFYNTVHYLMLTVEHLETSEEVCLLSTLIKYVCMYVCTNDHLAARKHSTGLNPYHLYYTYHVLCFNLCSMTEVEELRPDISSVVIKKSPTTGTERLTHAPSWDSQASGFSSPEKVS